MRRKKILCFTSYYLPGFKSGGPLRSLLHMQEWLGDEFEFAVVSRDRDAGDARPYAGLEGTTWREVRGIQVWYLSPPFWSPGPLRSAIAGFQPDVLYFHSSVDPALTIMPLMLRRLGRIPRELPVIVAPRGEFSPGARSLKARKKSVYFLMARILDLYRDVTWHATKEEEAAQVRELWGAYARVIVAPNLPGRLTAGEAFRPRAKEAGTLRLVFLSRICRMKNLHGALEILRGVTAPVTLDIHGIQEDAEYWAQCAALIGRLPANVTATYRGSVAPDEVIATLSAYDALFLPTLGENFGHVIHESLLAGSPVLISDQTPWRGLAAERVGFDIPLDRPDLYRQAIGQLAAMDSREHQTWSESARAYGVRYASDPDLVARTRDMLATAAR